MADPPFDGKDGIVGRGRQGRQRDPFLGEVLGNDASRRCVTTHVGNRAEPVAELAIEILGILEGATQEEVLADIAEGTLDLALGLGAIGPAGARQGTVVVEQRHQRPVVDHDAFGILVNDCGLHPVVEDLARSAAHRIEGIDVTSHNRLQVLGRAEPAP
jgi:hypothetical protein